MTNRDLLENFDFNPFGHKEEPKLFGEDEDRDREIAIIDNDTEPYWGTVNFGNPDAYRNNVVDANGTKGVQWGDAAPLTDMLENSKADSKVLPLPSGTTILALPGVRPDTKKLLGSMVYKPISGGTLHAPRSAYVSRQTVDGNISDKGKLDKTSFSSISFAVFQVPFGDEFMGTDTTGTATNLTDSAKMANTITKSLTDLENIVKTQKGGDALKAHFFEGNKLTTSYTNINNLINNGAYSDSYKNGLALALGSNMNGERRAPDVVIKSDIPNNDVYGQFDYIYDYMKNKKGKGVFSNAIVDWAAKNATPVIQTLMVNHALQIQFPDSEGGYVTPISWGYGDVKTLSFYKALNKKGRTIKDPFYLYAAIDGSKVSNLSASEGSIPVIPSEAIHPHLTYIYGLYTNIQSQVWVGAHGLNTDPARSQTWDDAVNAMDKSMKKDKLSKSIFKHHSEIPPAYSTYSNNNLTTGLSTAKGTKDRTSEVYTASHEVISALRLALPLGDNGGEGSALKLHTVTSEITAVKSTKYTGKSMMYKAFASSGGDMFDKWTAFIASSSKTQVYPAIFRSHWGGGSSYIMMPIMMGRGDFPKGVKILMEELAKPKGGGASMATLSNANHYVMAFNLNTTSIDTKKNTKGVVEIKPNKSLGAPLDRNKPVVITGYSGNDSFSIVDFYKAQDAIQLKKDSPDIKAKTTKGEEKALEHFSLFKDFFTVRNACDISGDKGKLKFGEGFDKEGYKTEYSSNSSSNAVKKVSPDYNTFFDCEKPTIDPINISNPTNDNSSAIPSST